MNLKQFKLKLDNDTTIKGEYEGNVESRKVIIFSHGFGVKRDSWGMFTELGDLLKKEYFIVQFDYNKLIPKENATYVYPYHVQAKILESVIGYVKKKFKPIEINIIAHSMGCLIVGWLSPDNVNKVILVASPTSSPYQRMKKYFSQRPETSFNEKDLSKIFRSDGSWTFIDKDFWDDVKKVDPPKMYTKLSRKSMISFIRAMQDEVITSEDYEPIKAINNTTCFELEGSHNFDGSARKPWLNKVVDLITQD